MGEVERQVAEMQLRRKQHERLLELVKRWRGQLEKWPTSLRNADEVEWLEDAAAVIAEVECKEAEP